MKIISLKFSWIFESRPSNMIKMVFVSLSHTLKWFTQAIIKSVWINVTEKAKAAVITGTITGFSMAITTASSITTINSASL